MGSVFRSLFFHTLALELIAFCLSIGAAFRGRHETVKVGDDGLLNNCRHRRGASTGLAIGASVCLLVAQVVISVVTRCTCCSSSSQRYRFRLAAIILLVISWISFVIAEFFLSSGARLRNFDVGNAGCKEVMQAIFVIGSAFTLVTLLVNVGYLWLYVKSIKPVVSGGEEMKPSHTALNP